MISKAEVVISQKDHPNKQKLEEREMNRSQAAGLRYSLVKILPFLQLFGLMSLSQPELSKHASNSHTPDSSFSLHFNRMSITNLAHKEVKYTWLIKKVNLVLRAFERLWIILHLIQNVQKMKFLNGSRNTGLTWMGQPSLVLSDLRY